MYPKVKTLETRQPKPAVDRAQLLDVWRRHAQAVGLMLDEPRQGVSKTPPENARLEPSQPTPRQAPADPRAVAAAVEYAIDHLTEREAVVEAGAVTRFALERGTGTLSLADVEGEIAKRVKKGELTARRDPRTAQQELTTNRAQCRELQALRIMRLGKRTLPRPIAEPEHVAAYLADTSLNDGQREAATLITTTRDRVVGIQGRPGTGKTTLLSAVQQIAEEHGFSVVGLAPSGQAAGEMGTVGIDSVTLAKFINTKGMDTDQNTLLVVDEASMVSARDMRYLLKRAEQVGARVALIGDTAQLKAVEAGHPFKQLQQAGMHTVVMDDIQRQFGDRYRASVSLAAEGQLKAALELVKLNVREVANHEARYQAIAEGYAQLTEAERRDTLVVSGTHQARQAINAAIRTALGLVGQGVSVRTLERVDLTRAQAKQVDTYHPGMVLEAERRYESLGIHQGERLTVVAVDEDKGTVRLRHENGRTLDWNPRRHTGLTAYRAEEREIAVGDKVQFSKGDNEAGIRNRDFGEVVALDAEHQTVTVKREDGAQCLLPTHRALHLDHGYAATIHSAQGASIQRIIVDLDTRAQTTNEAAFYVALSRGREALRIYTNDEKKLPEAIQRESCKRAALELTPSRHEPPERARERQYESWQL